MPALKRRPQTMRPGQVAGRSSSVIPSISPRSRSASPAHARKHSVRSGIRASLAAFLFAFMVLQVCDAFAARHSRLAMFASRRVTENWVWSGSLRPNETCQSFEYGVKLYMNQPDTGTIRVLYLQLQWCRCDAHRCSKHSDILHDYRSSERTRILCSRGRKIRENIGLFSSISRNAKFRGTTPAR